MGLMRSSAHAAVDRGPRGDSRPVWVVGVALTDRTFGLRIGSRRGDRIRGDSAHDAGMRTAESDGALGSLSATG